MSNEPIDLAAQRILRERRKSTRRIEPHEVQHIKDFAETFENVLTQWQYHVRINKLNWYFQEILEPVVGIIKSPFSVNTGNSINDLNLLSSIETKLNIPLVSMAPGATDSNPVGWMAGFKVNGRPITSPEMSSEAYARAFSILLFLRLTEDLGSTKQQTF